MQQLTTAQERMKATLSPELFKQVQDIAEILQPLIDEIHSKPPTGKDYYIDYMGILGKVASKGAGMVKLTAIAMTYAGCNPNGIEAAVKNVI